MWASCRLRSHGPTPTPCPWSEDHGNAPLGAAGRATAHESHHDNSSSLAFESRCFLKKKSSQGPGDGGGGQPSELGPKMREGRLSHKAQSSQKKALGWLTSVSAFIIFLFPIFMPFLVLFAPPEIPFHSSPLFTSLLRETSASL